MSQMSCRLSGLLKYVSLLLILYGMIMLVASIREPHSPLKTQFPVELLAYVYPPVL